jgi:tagaturonate reductase
MSNDLPDTAPEIETCLQFGTGKFLRGFADLFVHEANEAGRAAGRVVVVQSTGSERASALNDRGGRYHVAIRGLEHGRRVDRTVEVRSVSRALAASSDWDEVLAVARSESLRAIISNTTEAGYQLHPDDTPGDAPPRSFPAKLLAVLNARFEAGLAPPAILPCELLENNATRLVGLLAEQQQRWGWSSDLGDWIESRCVLPNTLVDRIVAAPSPGDPLAERDPLLAVAEPFALWLMDRSADVPGLVEHPAVRVVEDLGPFHLRKVRILNGAHTALVAKARPLGLETVRQAVEDHRVRPWLESLLFDEIVPTLEGRTEGPEPFAREVLERFANPFLEHRLADIALHHDVKLQTRLLPTLDEYRNRFGRTPRRLSEVAR